MIFKRQEGFRFKFEEPIQITFAMYENGKVNHRQTDSHGRLAGY